MKAIQCMRMCQQLHEVNVNTCHMCEVNDNKIATS